VTVRFTPPQGAIIAGLTVLVDYPEGKVQIPGTGSALPSGTITGLPPGAFPSANDLDHVLREIVGSGTSIPAGQLFRAKFQSCQGASVPTAGEFGCVVLEASDPFTNPVLGVTCTVTIP
jgi:hypothetical protein